MRRPLKTIWLFALRFFGVVALVRPGVNGLPRHPVFASRFYPQLPDGP